MAKWADSRQKGSTKFLASIRTNCPFCGSSNIPQETLTCNDCGTTQACEDKLKVVCRDTYAYIHEQPKSIITEPRFRVARKF